MQLESARGVAALIVVLYHFQSTSPLTANVLVQNSHPVDFFFVLSGFVIALNYGRLRTLNEAWAFMRRRFWRLYPLHAAMLLAYLGFETLQWLVEQRTGEIGEVAAFTVNGPGAIAAHATLTQAIVLPGLTLNVPSWSISTEFWAYAVFAAAILVGRGALLVVGAVAAIAVALLDGGALSATGAPGAIFRCLYGFTIGVLAHWTYARWKVPAPGWMAVGAVCFATALSIWGGLEMLVPPVFALLVVSLAQSSGGAMLWPPLVWVGTRSYSLYMVHFLAWQVATLALRRVGLDPSTLSPLAATGLVLAMIAVVLGLSAAGYALIERPFMSLGRRTDRRPIPEA